MANIAVINLAGTQHLVKAGDKFEVNKLENELDTVFTPSVLLSTKGDSLLFGEGTVETRVLEQKRGEKLYVIRFKAKSRYRRRIGHRQYVSLVEVISVNGEKAEKKERTTSKNAVVDETATRAPKTAKSKTTVKKVATKKKTEQ